MNLKLTFAALALISAGLAKAQIGGDGEFANPAVNDDLPGNSTGERFDHKGGLIDKVEKELKAGKEGIRKDLVEFLNKPLSVQSGKDHDEVLMKRKFEGLKILTAYFIACNDTKTDSLKPGTSTFDAFFHPEKRIWGEAPSPLEGNFTDDEKQRIMDRAGYINKIYIAFGGILNCMIGIVTLPKDADRDILISALQEIRDYKIENYKEGQNSSVTFPKSSQTGAKFFQIVCGPDAGKFKNPADFTANILGIAQAAAQTKQAVRHDGNGTGKFLPNCSL